MPSETALRTPPYSAEAEKAVIGSMLLDPWNAIAKVQRYQLKPETFFDKRHQALFQAFVDMTKDGRVIDVITYADYLVANGLLEKVGGYEYLEEVQDPSLIPSHVEHYSDIVRQRWIRREVIELLRGIESEAYLTEQGDALLKSIPEKFMGIVDEALEEETLEKSVDLMMVDFEKAAKGEKQLYGLEIPFHNLNDAMCGIPSGYGVIAARPSQGKTTLEDQLSCFWASQGIRVGRITVDMTARRLLERSASRAAGVSLPKIKKGNVKYGSMQWDQIVEEAARIKTWPMYITTETNLDAVCSWIRMMVIKHGLQVVTIDYIQQIYTRTRMDSDENTRLTVVSGTLKALANSLNIPIIVLSQLSRNSDKDRRVPTMADLRGSGSLEQDAQWIWMLYKDKDAEETKTLRPVWIDIVKNQDGETCGHPFWMYPNYFRFVETCVTYNGQGEEVVFEDIATHRNRQAESIAAEDLQVEG